MKPKRARRAAKAEAAGEKPSESATPSSLPLLIPGLSNDIALAILVRLPHVVQARLRLVCRSWKHAMEPAAMCSMRQMLHISEVWLVAWRFYNGCRTFLFKVVDPLHSRIHRVYSPPKLHSHRSSLQLNYFTIIGHNVLVAVKPQLGASIEALKWQGLYSFDAARMKWNDRKYSSLPSGVSVCAIDMDGGYVYAARSSICGPIKRLDLKTKKWAELPDPHVKRAKFAGVMLQNRFCIVGGMDQHRQVCTSGEIWDPINQEWTLVPELWPREVFGSNGLILRVAVVKDRLYALSACSQLSMELMYYETSSKAWISLGTVPIPGVSLFGMDEELWVGALNCGTVWTTKPSLSQPLSWRRLPTGLKTKDFNIYVGAMLV